MIETPLACEKKITKYPCSSEQGLATFYAHALPHHAVLGIDLLKYP